MCGTPDEMDFDHGLTTNTDKLILTTNTRNQNNATCATRSQNKAKIESNCELDQAVSCELDQAEKPIGPCKTLTS